MLLCLYLINYYIPTEYITLSPNILGFLNLYISNFSILLKVVVIILNLNKLEFSLAHLELDY